MKLCNDCRQNLCDDCYESDCDCNLASHTLAAALLLRTGADIVDMAFLSGDEIPDVKTGEVTLQILTKNGANDQAEFNLLINGRTYHVTVKA
jgi:hypothetical protein